MKRSNKKFQSGFTLLEVVVTIGIFSLILGYIMTYFSHEIRQYSSKENLIELKQNGRIALDRVVTKIRSYSGLILQTRGDGTISTIKDENDVVVINTDENASDGEIRYSYDSGKGFGELLDSSGNKIVGNIKQFSIIRDPENDQLLLITIICGNNRNDDERSYSTAVRLH